MIIPKVRVEAPPTIARLNPRGVEPCAADARMLSAVAPGTLLGNSGNDHNQHVIVRSMQRGVAKRGCMMDVVIYAFPKLLLLLFLLPLVRRLFRRLRFRLQPCGHPKHTVPQGVVGTRCGTGKVCGVKPGKGCLGVPTASTGTSAMAAGCQPTSEGRRQGSLVQCS